MVATFLRKVVGFVMTVACYSGAVAAASETPLDDAGAAVTYEIDVSFPIQGSVSSNYPWLPHNTQENVPTPNKYKGSPIQPLGDRHSVYLAHLKACRAKYPGEDSMCDVFENDRILMNRRQPMSMQNYTEIGFKKIRAPDAVFDLVQDFWKDNHFKGQNENWQYGNVYTNHWDAPSYLVSVDDTGLRGSGPRLKNHIWAAASATLEEWTSQELQPCSLYGIRVYSEGAIMLPHVDRLPLVASAAISVAQDLDDEGWPFEMYDHKGQAHNVTLQPGEMLLFESHSVIHGHPFPLRGRFAAFIFIHFEPTGHSLRHDASGNFYHDKAAIDHKYRKAVKDGFGGQSSASDGRLPPYIKRESPEEENWRVAHPEGWQPVSYSSVNVFSSARIIYYQHYSLFCLSSHVNLSSTFLIIVTRQTRTAEPNSSTRSSHSRQSWQN
jgi:prolyl 4-hydroxylase